MKPNENAIMEIRAEFRSKINVFDIIRIRSFSDEQKVQMHRLGDEYLKFYTTNDELAMYLRYQKKLCETPDERRERLAVALDLLEDLSVNGNMGMQFKAKLMKRQLLEYEFK